MATLPSDPNVCGASPQRSHVAPEPLRASASRFNGGSAAVHSVGMPSSTAATTAGRPGSASDIHAMNSTTAATTATPSPSSR